MDEHAELGRPQTAQPPPPPPGAQAGSAPPVAAAPDQDRWYDRRPTRIASIVALVVGVLLGGFGIARWVASSDTRAEADDLSAEVADLEDTAAAAAEAAGDAGADAAALEDRAAEVEGAITGVVTAAESSLTAFNAVIDCLNAVSFDFPAGRPCLDAPVADWRTAVDGVITARDDLQSVVEEDADA